MPLSLTWFRSLLAASALCAAGAALAPQALAQSQPTSCTLRAPLDLFSKPKGQGRRTHLSAGAVLEVLSHSSGWYTVYTGSAEAYVPATAFARACSAPARPATPPHPKAATDLIDIPLEPVPTAPAGPPSPQPAPSAAPELKDASQPPVVPPPQPQLAPEIAPPPPQRDEIAPPASYFEPPAPILERHMPSRNLWLGLEVGLWVGGGASVVTAAVLYTVNAMRASDARTEINAYNTACSQYSCNAGTTADLATQSQLQQQYAKAQSDADAVHTLNDWTIITGAVGVAALGAALGLHYYGPQALDGSSDINPMAMPKLRVGWGSFALEGTF